jgi:hypothetical protein
MTYNENGTKNYDGPYSCKCFCVCRKTITITITITMFSSTYFRFIDYQFCHFTNAAQDLQYFLHTSPSINLLDKHSVLVEEYHNTLLSTFTLLGHADLCPSLQQLHRQLDKLGRYVVVTACTALPLILADPNNVPDIEKVMKNEQSLRCSERYKDTLKTFLHSFEQKSWLDFETD